MDFTRSIILGIVFCLAFDVEAMGQTRCQIGYKEQSNSNYILPYPVGKSFVVGQGNCTDGSHDESQSYAYDFDMPIATLLIASRSGTVIAVVESFAENNKTPGQENYIIIEHEDGTISGYYHLTFNGVLIEVGSKVAQGEPIALSGNTGESTEPHLHFEIAIEEDGETLPVSFRNTRNHQNGLKENEDYVASPY